ncbi:MAG: flagellar assembly protein FliW, partial [Verrucomicrobiota bacterium]|nr:flagellar assembly protein FliW [Verrucomicrobiota bacterium]
MLTIEHKQQEAESRAVEVPEIKPGVPLHFASGLLGFETNKNFELISDEELNPYQWLKGTDADQSFLVIPPSYAVEDYSVELADDDVVMLELNDQADAVVLCIATY